MADLTFNEQKPLFASPLLHFTLQNAAELNALLLGEAHAMRAADAGIKRSNRNGWHSAGDFFHRTEPGCAALRLQLVEAVRQATLAISPKFDFTRWQLQVEGWINISGRGGYNAPHSHPGFAWSGVYYVAVPEATKPDSGFLEFLDPRTNVRVPTIEGASCFSDALKLQPFAGMLLLFPSYLLHWVYPNEEEAERMSIAFNARYIRKTDAV